jgi:hypothetical protein
MKYKGVQQWQSKNHYYSQENNPTEAYNKTRVNDRGGWLESCGPTSAVNCLAAMGKNVEITCPGVFKPQPEEVLMDYFNDPRNSSTLKAVRDLGVAGDSIPENRVPQYYPVAVRAVFGVSAKFEWGATWDHIITELDRGRAVQICLTDPGHYIAVVAYTLDDGGFLVYNDSWGSQYSDGKGGHNRFMNKIELQANVEPYRIIYRV